ncbi:phospholipase D-like domain-containing protein [Halovivax cerinus]|uniref:Phosphatidylserine/phosphatidylglycerophosphate/ cardiolipin synthase family protein n=1 Tax=Halovivax cerinus TaxID=1487865 RepID=A0ABD5NJB5_9EURY|nr:phospholipase D-like domain-containing protein [Halovivax cerinus]
MSRLTVHECTTRSDPPARAFVRLGLVLLVCLAPCATASLAIADVSEPGPATFVDRSDGDSIEPEPEPSIERSDAATGHESSADRSIPVRWSEFEDPTRDSASTSDEKPCANDGSGPAGHPSTPRIVELYPNPPTHGNVGEYLVVESPPNGTSELTVSDGYATATIPADRPPGRVAVSLDPNATRALTEHPVVAFDGHLRLAADGERLTLSTPTGPVDTVTYERAPEGERWYRSIDGNVTARSPPASARGSWWPHGRTCLPVATFDGDEATAFVLPDSPTAVTDVLASADDRIRLAGYTITDESVGRTLLSALDRGVAVEVLVEASPVGGLPAATRPLLDDLDAAGATVRIIGGPGDRYAFHHPKYAVVDDQVLVTTENWKAAGVGGESSRGWGVVVTDAELAARLGDVFDADASGRDVETWSTRLPTLDFVTDGDAGFDDSGAGPGRFPETHAPATVDVNSIELLLAPDNAGDRLIELIETADESIRIVQVQVGGPNFDLLRAALDAARDGVAVDLLLDGSWYVAEENRDLAERLEAADANEGVSLDVRITDGGERFEKIHAKGLIIDDEITVLGSLNWNDNALTENREVVLVLHGRDAAHYYGAVFDGDWRESRDWSVPVSIALIVLAGLAGSILLGKRYLRFERRPSVALTSKRDGRPTTRPVTIDRGTPASTERNGAGDRSGDDGRTRGHDDELIG